MGRLHLRVSACTPLLLLLPACGASNEVVESTTAPNVLLVTIDTLRADHLGCYGYFRNTSPNIDALASESVLFENCTVPMATTLPSHVSMLTGTWPLEHGVIANVAHGGKAYKPAPGAVSLSQALAEVGFSTAAFISAKPLRLNSGIDAGFAHFDDSNAPSRLGEVTTGRALDWMSEHLRTGAGQPFFLWVHLFDPHDPFKAPPPYAGTFSVDRDLEQFLKQRDISASSQRPGGHTLQTRPAHDAYDAEILYTDAQVGRILDALEQQGIADQTVFLLMTDHGEGLGQHDEPGHGLIWDEQVRCAWIMRAPGLAARRVQASVSSVDMLPTLLGNVEIPGLEDYATQFSGVNTLAAEFEGRPQFSQSSARLIQYGQPVMHSITRGTWKLHWHGEQAPVLYDLESDPHELHDRAGDEPAVVERLRDELLQHLGTLARRAAAMGAGEEIELDAATLKALRDLGYTGIDDE